MTTTSCATTTSSFPRKL